MPLKRDRPLLFLLAVSGMIMAHGASAQSVCASTSNPPTSPPPFEIATSDSNTQFVLNVPVSVQKLATQVTSVRLRCELDNIVSYGLCKEFAPNSYEGSVSETAIFRFRFLASNGATDTSRLKTLVKCKLDRFEATRGGGPPMVTNATTMAAPSGSADEGAWQVYVRSVKQGATGVNSSVDGMLQ